MMLSEEEEALPDSLFTRSSHGVGYGDLIPPRDVEFRSATPPTVAAVDNGEPRR